MIAAGGYACRSGGAGGSPAGGGDERCCATSPTHRPDATAPGGAYGSSPPSASARRSSRSCMEVLQDVTYANVDGKEVKGVLQVVKKGDDIGFRLAKFTTKEVDEFAKAATKNPDSKKIILGKYVENSPLSYDVIAKEGNYTYFNLDNWNEAFEMVGKNRDEMWRVNEKFLDDQIDKGKEIFFSHDPWKANGYFEKEVLYLIDKGAKDFVKLENGLWKAIW